MPNGSHMDAYRIYDLTVVHLVKCIFKFGSRAVNMLQAPCYLNPALIVRWKFFSHNDSKFCFECRRQILFGLKNSATCNWFGTSNP